MTCSEPLVEASLIESPGGAVVVLTNWSGRSVKALEVTFHGPLPRPNASLATGAKLATNKDRDRTVFTFDLDVADVLILR